MNLLRAQFRVDFPGFQLDATLDGPCEGVSVIFGPSGCGKTTLLRCIAGLEHAPGGFVQFGETVWQDDSKNLFVPVHRRSIGFVFQEGRLFPHLSVRGNLHYGSRRTPDSANKLAFDRVVDILDLHRLLDRRPHRLSGGEKQRVAMGRALLTAPRLLLMDEPLASLDQARKEEIIPFLLQIRQEFKLPILYVSHSLNEVLQLVDTLVVMHSGQIIAQGPASEVVSNPELNLPETRSIAGTLLTTTVAGFEPEYGLAQLQFNDRTLYVPNRGARLGQPLRVHILAQDVSIALEPHTNKTSVLNCVPGRIQEIGSADASEYSVNIRLDVGQPLLATITRKSLKTLDLQPGQQVYALIKAVKTLNG